MIPDAIEPVIGYRCWALEGGYLKPTNSDFIWQPGENQAICYAQRGEFNKKVWKNVDGELRIVKLNTHGLIPEASCNCGFWVLKTPQDLLDRMIAPKPRDDVYSVMATYWGPRTSAQFVIGQVRGWGRVLPGENGWRAEYAAVDSIIQVKHRKNVVSDERLEAVAALYEVPVVREEAFDGKPESTAKQKAKERKKAEQNYLLIDDAVTSSRIAFKARTKVR